MADFPAELSTGMVHGRFIVAVIDSEDEGQDPDVVPAQGKVAFKASVGYIPVPVATGGPVTVMKGPIMGVLDSEGYLCTPYPATDEPMYRGVRLVSTDDPDMAVTDWTWSADYRLEAVNGNSMQIPAHSFALPSGSEVDLTTLVKVPSSPGYGLPQAEAAVLRAEAAAGTVADARILMERSELAADRAEAPTDLMNKNLIEDPASLTAGALSAAIDESVSPVKRRTRRDIERSTTGIVRRATIPAGLGWEPGVPILTDGARYWSPVDVETMRPAGGKTFYISSSHGVSTGSGQELGTLTTPVEAGATVTSLEITASAQATNSTAKLAVIVGTEWVPVTVSASVAAGATTVSVQSLTPGFTLPRGSKLVAVRNRLHDIYGPTLNYVAAGDTVVFLDKVNYYNAIQALKENKGVGLVGIRPGTIISMSEKETWTLTSGNVYQAARTNVRTVVDIAADKDGFEYTRVSSVAECEALPGSWFQATDGTGSVYVRTLQGGAPNPETHHALLTTENINFTPPGGSTVFLKNLRFIGGLNTVMVDGSEATPVRFLVKDCDFLWGGYGPVGATDATIASSLHIRGNVEAYMQRLRVGHATRDALDYVGLSGYAPRFVEIDCEAFAAGMTSISLAVDPTNATFNASTAHDGAVGIRVGGKYHDTRGTVVADVHVGTKSANYGLDVWGSTSGFELFNAAISAQQDGTEMWLYGCRAWGTKNDIVAVGTAVVHVLGETEYDSIGGTGSILTD